MKKIIAGVLIVAGIAFGWLMDAQYSIPEKINAAFPPSPLVKVSLENIDISIPPEDKNLKSFKSSYQSKLTLRALTCSQGISINRFDSIKKIRTLPIDKDCLKDYDDQLLQVIGLRLVGYKLEQSPLRPLEKLGASTVINSVSGTEVFSGEAAEKAGVMVLKGTRGELTSLEIPGGKKISNLSAMPDGSSEFKLSPNGRISAFPVNNKELRFIDNETGLDLWVAKDANKVFAWLPEVQSIIIKSSKNGGEMLLVDLASGIIKTLTAAPINQSWALHLSESPSRVLIGSYRDFNLIELTRTANGIDSAVIKYYKIESPRASVSSHWPTLMQNGQSIVFVSGRDYMRYNLDTREEKLWESSELVSNNYAKLSEDTILVDSYSLSGSGKAKPYAFNIKTSTLSPIDSEDASEGIVYSMDGRTGYIRRGYQKVWIGDDIKLGTPESIDTMIASRKLEKQLLMLETEERMARAREEAMKMASLNDQMRQMNAPQNARDMLLRRQLMEMQSMSMQSASAPLASPSASISGYDAASIQARKQAILNATTQRIGTIPSDAKVEAIGVYETKDRSPAGVTVLIKKSNKPIVLMLSAYEPVRWNLIKELGANLVAVIATGYNVPVVTGANGTRTMVKRGSYAYEKNSPGYAAWNSDAIMWTGKPIGNFQGIYGGTTFVVQ